MSLILHHAQAVQLFRCVHADRRSDRSHQASAGYARDQIWLGQHEPIDYRMEAALVEAEEAIANARALVAY
jgi:hypothetical protein